MMAGTLHVVATPIGNLGDLSPRAASVLAQVDLVACEDTRRTAALFAHLGVSRPEMVVVNAHTERRSTERIIRRLRDGAEVALVSDAGTPAVSDPGHRLVEAAVASGIDVTAVPGPSAVLAALVLSGLDPGRFCFEGFLPRKGRERADRLAQLAREPRTSVVLEAPHRIATTLADLVDALGPTRRAAVARELTKLHEEVWRGPLAELAGRAEAEPLRGEIVVVVEGATPPPVADEVLLEALNARLGAGGTRRDAVDAVSRETGVARNRVYELALTIGRS